MRRYYYKKPYRIPKPNQPTKDNSRPLLQPEWDDTVNDLTRLKLSPEEQLRRRLSRISHNQLGVALLRTRTPKSGTGSSRYTSSEGSAEAAGYESNSDTGSSTGEQAPQQHAQKWGATGVTTAAAAHCGVAETDSSGDDDDVCQWQNGLNSPLHQQQQQQPQYGQSIIQGDSNNTVTGVHASSQRQGSQMLRNSTSATAATVQVEEDGRLMIDPAVLQLLLDKIDTLEKQHKQQGKQHPGRQAEHGLYQQLEDSQQQVAETQQQLLQLQDEHREYVNHTSSLLTRLQEQLQQLMSQAPGLVGEAGAGSETAVRSHRNAAALQSDPWQQVPRSSSPPPAGSAAAAAVTAPVGLTKCSSSSSAAAKSPAKSHLRPATAVSVTALPHKTASTAASSQKGSPVKTAAAAGRSTLESYAAHVVEAIALPSYAEMRQRRSQSGPGAAWQQLAPVTVEHGSCCSNTAGNSQNACFNSTLHASEMECKMPHSRPVPARISTLNPAAAVAAALSGGTCQVALESTKVGQADTPGSWRNEDQVPPVISSACGGPASMLAPALAGQIYAELPEFHGAGWGLIGNGLPRASVNRVFTASGVAAAAELPPRPRVMPAQLAGSVSLLDHLRAAQATQLSAADVPSRCGHINRHVL